MSTPAITSLLSSTFYSSLTRGSTPSLEALRSMLLLDLLSAQMAFTSSAFLLDAGIPIAEPLRPTSGDPALLPLDFAQALSSGRLSGRSLSKSLLLSIVRDEGAALVGQLNPGPTSPESFAAQIQQLLEPSIASAVLTSSREEYSVAGSNGDLRKALTAIATERFWTCAVRNIAGLWVAKGGKAYVAEFESGIG